MSIKIIVPIGLQGSGKSSWCSNNTIDSNYIFSSDKLRKKYPNYDNQEIFKTLYENINKAISDNSNATFFLDATNINLKNRSSFFNQVDLEDVEVEAKIFNLPFYKCLKNNERRQDYDPKSYVPVEAISRYRKNFQMPIYKEGFDSISFAYPYPFEGILRSEILKLMVKDQKNPHHNQNILEHCLFVKEKCLFDSELSCVSDIDEIALFHDFGKVLTQTFDDNGVAHYYHHANVGAWELGAKGVLLPWKNKVFILQVINYHMQIFDLKSSKSQKRWKERLGEDLFSILKKFNVCDKMRYTEVKDD